MSPETYTQLAARLIVLHGALDELQHREREPIGVEDAIDLLLEADAAAVRAG